ncbi:hypothetical protein PAHAL_3G301100 [Panicum hallii]|uniref:Uncharacterized protein n=1 Tax=Panicum hallii TaxID=206008 RepID=A0A2T8KJV4_9POAL|nr:hypothetical protein PAHAL_3G301100 [Panicum hallii]
MLFLGSSPMPTARATLLRKARFARFSSPTLREQGLLARSCARAASLSLNRRRRDELRHHQIDLRRHKIKLHRLKIELRRRRIDHRRHKFDGRRLQSASTSRCTSGGGCCPWAAAGYARQEHDEVEKGTGGEARPRARG